MIIKSTTFNILLAKSDNIRRKMMLMEEDLMDFFLPINILPIPDDAPKEIPRVLMTTRNGHTNIQISPQSITMTTNYDGDFVGDWDKCLHYLREKLDRVLSIVKNISDGNGYFFSGLSTSLYVENEKNPLNILKDKLIKLKTNEDFYDINCKLTLAKDDYYINISYMNARQLEVNPTTMKPIRVVNSALQIVLDVNDRYGFNTHEGYLSDESKITRILEISSELIPMKLYDFLEKGEIII